MGRAALPWALHAAGRRPHHYTFTLIATDLEPGALPARAHARRVASKASKGHAKGATRLIGLFENPY